jgi:hypothetical protein
MLITLPDSDITIKYASTWSEKIIKTAEKNGINPIPIRDKNVTRTHVEKDIKSKNPRFLVFNGHGSDDSIFGQNDETLIKVGKNEKLLKSRIVHSFTCNSAKELGRKCGAEAFIGYDNYFIFFMDKFSLNHPLEDKLAGPVMECAIEVPLQIVKGKTAGEAYAKSQEMYEKWINEYTISSSHYTTEELQLILPCLYWNKSCQKLHGNPDAKFSR